MKFHLVEDILLWKQGYSSQLVDRNMIKKISISNGIRNLNLLSGNNFDTSHEVGLYV